MTPASSPTPPTEPGTVTSDTSSAPKWQPQKARGSCIGSVTKFVFFSALLIALVLPFTPFASKIKRGLQQLIETARSTKERIVTRDVIKEVPVTREVIKEVIKEVQPPLPDKFIPRKDVDVATLFNNITVKTNLITEEGGFASLERLDPEAYKAEFQLSIRVPKANQTLADLSRINPNLPKILPGLEPMLTTAKVSGFYHKLYQSKTSRVQNDLTRLNKILDRHNYYDCETILELTHPTSQRRVLLVQSEMDVVADGSDGDRMPTLDEYIYLSDYYQPSTSYAWPKVTSTPNPLVAKWEERLKKAKEDLAVKGLSSARNRELSNLIQELTVQISEMKSRSFLIAEKDPFVVISLLFRGYSEQNKHTPQIGDYACVIHEGKIYPAICGDYGPSYKMGEASLLMSKTINPKSTPYIRGENDLKVTYLFFPGSADKPNTAPNLAKWRERCQQILSEIGGVGTGFELHTWVDPFAKPDPNAPAGAASPTGSGATPASPANPATPGAPNSTVASPASTSPVSTSVPANEVPKAGIPATSTAKAPAKKAPATSKTKKKK